MLPIEKASRTLVDGTTNPDFVPWHRVVNAQGRISPRGSVRYPLTYLECGQTSLNMVYFHFPKRSAEARQASWLEEEGVEVSFSAGTGIENHADFVATDGGRVKLAVYGWFPSS